MDGHISLLNKFVADEAQRSVELILYAKERRKLQRMFPSVVIAEGEPFKNHLYRCKVYKW
jgi:hypothetical protein